MPLETPEHSAAWAVWAKVILDNGATPLLGAAGEGRGAETLGQGPAAGRPVDGWVWGLLETNGETFLSLNISY